MVLINQVDGPLALHSPYRLWRWLAALMLLMAAQIPGQASELQLEEQLVVEHLATQAPWPEQASKRFTHPLGMQTLFIERLQTKHKQHLRQARIYQYDYSRQSARLLDIDLDTREVMRVRAIDSVHLPLSEQEIAFATTLLEQDGPRLARLRTEQTRRGIPPFVTLDELEVKASIHEPLDAEHPCAASRCALLSLFDASHTVFATEPLINLNTQQVGELFP